MPMSVSSPATGTNPVLMALLPASVGRCCRAVVFLPDSTVIYYLLPRMWSMLTPMEVLGMALPWHNGLKLCAFESAERFGALAVQEGVADSRIGYPEGQESSTTHRSGRRHLVEFRLVGTVKAIDRFRPAEQRSVNRRSEKPVQAFVQ